MQVTNPDWDMTLNLLHIDSSIQGDASASRTLSAAIVSRLQASGGGVQTTYRDLAAEPLPHLTLDAFASGQAQAVIEEFLRADVVVIGAAMYNFTIPSQLKAWIDRILVAGKTFRYTAQGTEGLAGDKRVIVALARGGIYTDGGPAASLEHAETYLRGILAFVGITDPEFVIAEGLALGDEARRAGIDGALELVRTVVPQRLAA